MSLNTRRIAFAGILAAVYAVTTYVCQPIAYGSIQFRLSEALAVFCCFTPAAIPGMVLGCVVANIFTTLSFPVLDIVFGSLATLLAALMTARYGKKGNTVKNRILGCLMPVIFNAVIVGAMIAYFFTEGESFLPAFGYNALSVGAGEAAVMYLLGLPLLFFLRKNRQLRSRLEAI